MADTSDIVFAEASQLAWLPTQARVATPALVGTAYTVTGRTINSGFLGINGGSGPHSWQANVRHDGNSQFGDDTTGFAGYGYRITPSWRASASYGTSFVAPSFNQLYFPGFGNPAHDDRTLLVLRVTPDSPSDLPKMPVIY